MKTKISTYDRNDFYNNWEKINKDLGKRWDEVVKHSPHKELEKPTLTDLYFVSAITKLIGKWMKKKKGLKLLKFDLYNEATMTSYLADWFLARDYDYFGVDISREVVKLAKKNFKGRVEKNHFLVGDIRKLPFKDNTFDFVFSFGTIEHIRENEQAVKEAFRVLKPGGLFITGVNNKLDMWFSYFVNEATNRIFKNITSYEPSYFPWDQRRWLKEAGFMDIKVTGMITFPHIIRYIDLFIEWKKVNGLLRSSWDNLVIRPLVMMANFLDSVDSVRRFGMHTTALGIKPKSSMKAKA